MTVEGPGVELGWGNAQETRQFYLILWKKRGKNTFRGGSRPQRQILVDFQNTLITLM